jgi:hypothetical protein
MSLRDCAWEAHYGEGVIVGVTAGLEKGMIDSRGFGIDGTGLMTGATTGTKLLPRLLGFVLPGTLGLLPLPSPALLPGTLALLGFVFPGTLGLLPLASPALLLPGALALLGLVLPGTLGLLPLPSPALLPGALALRGFVFPGTLGLLPLPRPALLAGTLALLGFVFPGTLRLLPGTLGFARVCAERTETAMTQLAKMPKHFIR